jgi:hypothetical protein
VHLPIAGRKKGGNLFVMPYLGFNNTQSKTEILLAKKGINAISPDTRKAK